jgi:hypothetical protein
MNVVSMPKRRIISAAEWFCEAIGTARWTPQCERAHQRGNGRCRAALYWRWRWRNAAFKGGLLLQHRVGRLLMRE